MKQGKQQEKHQIKPSVLSLRIHNPIRAVVDDVRDEFDLVEDSVGKVPNPFGD